MRLRSKRGDPQPPYLGGNLDRQSACRYRARTAVRLAAGGNKPWLVWPACAWPAVPASPLPCAFTPPPRSPTANDHEVLNGIGRRPASCPAMLPAVTAGW